MLAFGELFASVGGVFLFIFRYWWLWLPPSSVVLFINVFLAWRRAIYKSKIEWSMLEIKMPRELEKSPKAMEQFFAGIHPLRNDPNTFLDKYREGEVPLWFSLEVVSLSGDIHIYIRTPSKHKQIVISNLYANYPTLEIEETGDYMDLYPEKVEELYQQGRDMYGRELLLSKPDAYPIRTYVQFENIEESMALDPIGSLLEIFSRVGSGENIAFQIVVRPAKADWVLRAKEVVKKIKEEGVKKIPTAFGEMERQPTRTPGETDFLKIIEWSLTKPGFETLIRYVYFADKGVMNKDFARRGVASSLNQYASPDLNSFTPNAAVSTDVHWVYFPHVFPERRLEARKRRMWRDYRLRKMPEESDISKFLTASVLNWNFSQRTFVLNIEELATLFHPPTKLVLTGQLLERVTSKKLGPPSGLPIFGGGTPNQ